MPSTTRKQEIAMQIAAAGKSNIGIPQKVGKEFVKADRRKKMAGYGSSKIGNPHGERQAMGGMRDREAYSKKVKRSAPGRNPGYMHTKGNPHNKKKPKYSTGGTVGGGVGNVEYRHDGPHKSRNPQTRGTKRTGYATGYGSRNKQTPDNYYVQDGASKMQRSMVHRLRSNKTSGRSSSQFAGSKYMNQVPGSNKSLTGMSY